MDLRTKPSRLAAPAFYPPKRVFSYISRARYAREPKSNPTVRLCVSAVKSDMSEEGYHRVLPTSTDFSIALESVYEIHQAEVRGKSF